MGLQGKAHPGTHRDLWVLECSLSSCLNYSSPNAIHVSVLGVGSLHSGISYSPRTCDIVSPGSGAKRTSTDLLILVLERRILGGNCSKDLGTLSFPFCVVF